MELKRLVKKQKTYREERNKLIVFLMKVHKWSAQDVQEDALERQYGHKITRVRVQQIYDDYKKDYPKRVFRNYEAPDTL